MESLRLGLLEINSKLKLGLHLVDVQALMSLFLSNKEAQRSLIVKVNQYIKHYVVLIQNVYVVISIELTNRVTIQLQLKRAKIGFQIISVMQAGLELWENLYKFFSSLVHFLFYFLAFPPSLTDIIEKNEVEKKNFPIKLNQKLARLG